MRGRVHLGLDHPLRSETFRHLYLGVTYVWSATEIRARATNRPQHNEGAENMPIVPMRLPRAEMYLGIWGSWASVLRPRMERERTSVVFRPTQRVDMGVVIGHAGTWPVMRRFRAVRQRRLLAASQPVLAWGFAGLVWALQAMGC